MLEYCFLSLIFLTIEEIMCFVARFAVSERSPGSRQILLLFLFSAFLASAFTCDFLFLPDSSRFYRFLKASLSFSDIYMPLFGAHKVPYFYFSTVTCHSVSDMHLFHQAEGNMLLSV